MEIIITCRAVADLVVPKYLTFSCLFEQFSYFTCQENVRTGAITKTENLLPLNLLLYVNILVYIVGHKENMVCQILDFTRLKYDIYQYDL